jgi:hypothetical protein
MQLGYESRVRKIENNLSLPVPHIKPRLLHLPRLIISRHHFHLLVVRAD